MNTLSYKQIELYNLINQFNIQDIERIVAYAKKNIHFKKATRKSLAGIWSEYNFNTIDIEQEIRQLRKDINNNLN